MDLWSSASLLGPGVGFEVSFDAPAALGVLDAPSLAPPALAADLLPLSFS